MVVKWQSLQSSFGVADLMIIEQNRGLKTSKFLLSFFCLPSKSCIAFFSLFFISDYLEVCPFSERNYEILLFPCFIL